MEEEGLPAIYYPFHRPDFRSSRSLPVPDQGSVWPNKKVAERFDAEIEEDWEGFSVWVREVLIHGNGFNGDQHMFKDSLIGGSILSATLGKFSREGSSRQRDNATSPQTLSTLNRQVGACFAEEELMIYGLSRFSPSQVFVTTLLFPNRHFMWRRCDICVWFWGDREAPLRLVCFLNWGLALLGLSTMIVRGACHSSSPGCGGADAGSVAAVEAVVTERWQRGRPRKVPALRRQLQVEVSIEEVSELW